MFAIGATAEASSEVIGLNDQENLDGERAGEDVEQLDVVRRIAAHRLENAVARPARERRQPFDHQ